MKYLKLSNLFPLWLKELFKKSSPPINKPTPTVDEEYLRKLIESRCIDDHYDDENYS
jgi:hypothetical protein